LRRSKFSQALWCPQHLIGVALHSGPAKLSYLINDFSRARSAGGQIAAMDDQIRRNQPQVIQNCFEGAAIAVDIGYDCDSHVVGAAWRG
jgi:hypothetical protein